MVCAYGEAEADVDGHIEAGYVVKDKDGRRNRYHIQAHLPLEEPLTRERSLGEVLKLLAATKYRDTARRS